MIQSSPSAHPRVAVIVPAYGVAHLVGESLASLQAQTLTDWECLVIDDGAPDDVAGAVAPFLSDPRIRFLATDNRGVSGARNRAIREARAPLIALLDGDDRLRPTYLETTVSLLESNADLRLVTCNALQFGAIARECLCVERPADAPHPRLGTLAQVIDRSFNVYIGTTFRHADFDAVGGFDETMAQSEDFDFWVRLMMLGGHAYYVDEALGDYRIRPGSASASIVRMILGNIKVYEKAARTLPADAPEQAVLRHMIADSRSALGFEYAIDRIIEGDIRRGLQELREHAERLRGLKWRAFFAVWRVAPSLAQPMLRWRRQLHSRGALRLSLFRRAPRAA